MHVVLLGDSVFDNAVYVPGEPAVPEQVRAALPAGWRVTTLAVDGDVTRDVAHQLGSLPSDATHLAVSVGGNDALQNSSLLWESAGSTAEVLDRMSDIQRRFRDEYQGMLQQVAARGLPTVICTIYDAIPGFLPGAIAALSYFNDVILRAAIRLGMPVIDLREICREPADFSSLSPIEPSAAGGQRIARVLATAVTRHDFGARRAVVYK